jgi:uncharacterized protein (TIGR04255 family)
MAIPTRGQYGLQYSLSLARTGQMAKKPSSSDRLPNAPLVEVVFEMRWELQTGPDGEQILHSDPGLVSLVENFSKRAKKLKFSFARDMSHPLQTFPYGVVRRFFRNAESPFPILQVGQGILASNESSQYEWKSFKAQSLLALRTLFQSYPKMDFFTLRPNQLELRYIDVFDKTILGHASLFPFLDQGTSIKLGLPPMMKNKKLLRGNSVGRFNFQSELKDRKSSHLLFEVGSGKNLVSDEDIIRMETKIVSKADGVPSFENAASFVKDVGIWLEFAHGITSPLFKQVIIGDVMAKFEGQ